MNILEALASTAPQARRGRCKLQRFLEDIPADQPGKADLEAAVADPRAYPAHRLAAAIALLSGTVSPSLINAHRGTRCSCYLGA